MPKYKYLGKEEANVARLGIVKPGGVYDLSDELAAGVEKCARDLFKRLPDPVKPITIGQGAITADGLTLAAGDGGVVCTGNVIDGKPQNEFREPERGRKSSQGKG